MFARTRENLLNSPEVILTWTQLGYYPCSFRRIVGELAESRKQITFTLHYTAIEKLTAWSEEFRLSKASIVDRILRSLNVVSVMLEKFRESRAITRGIYEKTGLSFQTQRPSPKSLFGIALDPSVLGKKIRLELSAQARAVLEGLVVLLGLSRSELMDAALQYDAVESAIRKELHSSR